MKKKIFIYLLLLIGIKSFSQKAINNKTLDTITNESNIILRTHNYHLKKQWTIIINRGHDIILTNKNIPLSIESIKSIDHFNEKDSSQKEYNLPKELFKSGIITITVKKRTKIQTKKQSELNSFFGVPKNRNIYLNGFLIEDKSYSIDINSINKIEILEINNEKNLNIWNLKKLD